MDILLQSALNYQKLLDIQYIFIYGHRKKEYVVKLNFKEEFFYHLVGFQHMKDMAQYVRYKRNKALKDVINGKITLNQISRSIYYHTDIEPRLNALIVLEQILDSNFETAKFEKHNYNFYTEIEAEYVNRCILINKPEIQFFFTIDKYISEESDNYFCITAFEKEDRDYFKGTRFEMIYKKKIDVKNNIEIEIFNKMNHPVIDFS